MQELINQQEVCAPQKPEIQYSGFLSSPDKRSELGFLFPHRQHISVGILYTLLTQHSQLGKHLRSCGLHQLPLISLPVWWFGGTAVLGLLANSKS